MTETTPTSSVAEFVTLHHPFGRVFENIPTGLFINNEFVPSKSGKKFDTVDPNSGNVITSVYEADADDVNIAVEAAKTGFERWSKVSPRERGEFLYKLGDLVHRDREIFAGIEAYDTGKPYIHALVGDVYFVEENLKYFAGAADKVSHGRHVDIREGVHAYTRPEPYGVVGLIVPWNFPLSMLAWKIGPALAAGNSIVVKSSEKTPLSALKFAQLIVEAGFPPGVVNIISGFGPSAGDAIARHSDIHRLSFTGSVATGRKILAASAESNLKKVTLELGGKCPNVVFNDAKLDAAVQACTSGYSFNQGQLCCAGTRVYVQEGIYDVFLERIKADAAKIKVGNSFDADTDMGPLVDKLQFDRVMNYIEEGKKAGAHIEFGGHRVGTEGYYVSPTIFTNIHDDMAIVKEEIFGPVIVVEKFSTLEDGIAKANNTEFGLAASIHTTDVSTYIKAANAIQAGTVWVNTHNLLYAGIPFGGYKLSGFGREGGLEAIQEYTQLKSVYVALV